MQKEPISLDVLAKVYVRIREKIQEETARYDNAVEPLKATLNEVKLAMKDTMQELGTKTARTDHGTIILSTKTRYVAQDWEALKEFILANDALDILEKRISQKPMETFLVNNPGNYPPGLSQMSEIDVTVRKAT